MPKTLANPADNREIITRLRNIQPVGTRRWGTMSPHEMVCHLSDSLRMVMGDKACSRAPLREQPAPFLARGFVKWFALKVPLPWPKGVATRPELDPHDGGTRPATFDADLPLLLALHERFTRRPRMFTYAAHPIFGAMTEAEWMRWGYLHADHHLRQFGL